VEKKKGSWIALILFCMVTTVIAALALAVVLTSITILSSSAQSADSPTETPMPTQTFVGIITDAHCGAKHKLADKAPAECTRICVKDGSGYVLVDGDKVHALQGDIVKLNRSAGERVTVTGSLHNNVIAFTSITVGP
jgi:hypothetical protein